MRQSFFDDDERILSLRESAITWLQTPFVAHAQQIGAGVDCIHLVLALYQDAGLIQHVDLPPYSLDSGHHSDAEVFRPLIEQSGLFDSAWEPGQPIQVKTGDLLLFRVGRIAFHCGVAINPVVFVHAMHLVGVTRGSVRDSTWAKRLMSVYRPMEVEALCHS